MVISTEKKEYGGCLHFEKGVSYGSGQSYYSRYQCNKVDVDSGRSAIQYILEEYRFKRIWLPVYNCPLVAKRIAETSNVEIRWYNLTADFLPDVEAALFEKDDVLLWVNYCGVMFDEVIDRVVGLQNRFGIRVIIDNIPAYFSEPRCEAINIYSCRKFLGVPDGGHIIAGDLINKKLPTYSTADNYYYLLKAIETGSNSAYEDYHKSEKRFSEAKEAYGMPVLTEKILCTVDYEAVIQRRRANFELLHDKLKDLNGLRVDFDSWTPSVYPYLARNIKLREALIDDCIYISRFWKHVLTNELANKFERKLAEFLIPLPIDQRYGCEDMEYIAQRVIEFESLLRR